MTLGLVMVGTTLSPAIAVASGNSLNVADDQETPPPPPQGVSPANQDIEPPNMCDWTCPRCGASVPSPKGYTKRQGHGPMWGPHSEYRGGQRMGKAGKMGKTGRARKAGGRQFRGGGLDQVDAAQRMLRHADELGLTDEQMGELEMISYETKKKLIDLRANIEKEQLEVQKQLRSGSEDLTQIKRHLSAVEKSRVGIQEARIANLFNSRNILTDGQKTLIKEKHPRLGMILD